MIEFIFNEFLLFQIGRSYFDKILCFHDTLNYCQSYTSKLFVDNYFIRVDEFIDAIQICLKILLSAKNDKNKTLASSGQVDDEDIQFICKQIYLTNQTDVLDELKAKEILKRIFHSKILCTPKQFIQKAKFERKSSFKNCLKENFFNKPEQLMQKSDKDLNKANKIKDYASQSRFHNFENLKPFEVPLQENLQCSPILTHFIHHELRFATKVYNLIKSNIDELLSNTVPESWIIETESCVGLDRTTLKSFLSSFERNYSRCLELVQEFTSSDHHERFVFDAERSFFPGNFFKILTFDDPDAIIVQSDSDSKILEYEIRNIHLSGATFSTG